MLEQLGHADIALLRDPDMTPAQRFVTKLARALILRRPRLVIDRPGAMLYDVPYPVFIRQLAAQAGDDGHLGNFRLQLEPGTPGTLFRMNKLHFKVGLFAAASLLLGGSFVVYLLHARGFFEDTYPSATGRSQRRRRRARRTAGVFRHRNRQRHHAGAERQRRHRHSRRTAGTQCQMAQAKQHASRWTNPSSAAPRSASIRPTSTPPRCPTTPPCCCSPPTSARRSRRWSSGSRRFSPTSSTSPARTANSTPPWPTSRP